MDVTPVVDVLNSLGILPVVLLVATLGIARLLYSRFTRGAVGGGSSSEYDREYAARRRQEAIESAQADRDYADYRRYGEASYYGISREEVDANELDRS